MSSAADRGWGSGWPNGQADKQVRVVAGGVKVNVRREVAPLFEWALRETAKVGYQLKQEQTGAYVNRPIGGTRTASNHSWGLAIDLNWQENPFTRDANAKRTITPAVVAVWKRAGFSWGGDWSGKKDFMHFEFVGTPGDAATLVARLPLTAHAATTKEEPMTAAERKEVEALRSALFEDRKVIENLKGMLERVESRFTVPGLAAPVVDAAVTPSGGGYWLVAADGGVFNRGDAGFHGSLAGTKLEAAVCGIEATETGRGYTLFAADGGVFPFGDAVFHGTALTAG